MPECGLGVRIEQAKALHDGGNDELYLWNCYEVQHLLTLLDFDDLLPEEVISMCVILAQAYGRKLAGGPPPLRLIPQGSDGPQYLAG